VARQNIRSSRCDRAASVCVRADYIAVDDGGEQCPSIWILLEGFEYCGCALGVEQRLNRHTPLLELDAGRAVFHILRLPPIV